MSFSETLVECTGFHSSCFGPCVGAAMIDGMRLFSWCFDFLRLFLGSNTQNLRKCHIEHDFWAATRRSWPFSWQVSQDCRKMRALKMARPCEWCKKELFGKPWFLWPNHGRTASDVIPSSQDETRPFIVPNTSKYLVSFTTKPCFLESVEYQGKGLIVG